MFRRRGGLVRAAATTAVVAGTAGAVRHHQDQKYAAQDQAAVRAAVGQQAAAQQTYAAPPPAAPAEPDYMDELAQLAQLKAQGIITDEEFEAKKKQLLGHLGPMRSWAGSETVRRIPPGPRPFVRSQPTHDRRARPPRTPASEENTDAAVGSPDPEPDEAPAPHAGIPRLARPSIAARLLVFLGIVFLVVSLLSNFVKREALDKDNFRNTSEELIANDVIRDQLASSMVETLYANVDVSAQLKDQLPKNLQGLSGPIAGVARDAADRGAREVLDRPARAAALRRRSRRPRNRSSSKVLENKTERLDTTNGNVVLDIRPLVLQLGDRFQFVSNLEQRIPEDSGKITLLSPTSCATAQDLTQWLKAVADWIWVLVILCWARRASGSSPAVAAARCGRSGSGSSSTGVLLLVIRSVAGNYIVDNVVVTESVKPAVNEMWEILTDSLAACGLEHDRRRRARGHRRLAHRARARCAVDRPRRAGAADAPAGGRVAGLRDPARPAPLGAADPGLEERP